MDAGRATSTLSKFMTEHGATLEEVTQAQSDLAKGQGIGAPQPATELVKKWALLMSTAATMGTGSASVPERQQREGLLVVQRMSVRNSR
ncbi:TPA: hypothetical protein JD344_24885 [Serratia marcescens]|nr:hypothetical protein AM681_13880 [Serratia marcescens]AVU40748.1 hypothetical protein AS658_13715 [Serratia marcescens]HAU5721791.1 hypothetical protein [Serratia marcescens]HAU5741884.1 hypothetical protein [Serratia marcescens]HAU5747580.1 hypothetical protein [Serratia marcescens]